MKSYEEITDIFTADGVQSIKQQIKEAKPFPLVLKFNQDGEYADYKIKAKGSKIYAKRIALAKPEEVGVKDA